MAITLVELAKQKIPMITPAEAMMLSAAESGKEAEAPQPLMVVRSEVIEWLCTTPSAHQFVHRHGIALKGFIIANDLDLIDAEIPFRIQFHWCIFDGQIWLKGAKLRSISLRGTKINGLNADSATITANVLLIDGFESHGELAFREAMIGSLRVDGAKLQGEDSFALICDRAKIRGGVFLSQKLSTSEFKGEVRFAGAEVGGNLDCEGGTFHNPAGVAFNSERAQIAGSLFLRDSQARGNINLMASKIGVALDCRGAKFSSGTERTLNAEKICVGSHVLLDGDFACDTVHLHSAMIGGGLRCYVSQIGKLDVRHCRVEDLFQWTEMREVASSSIDFRNARLNTIQDEEESWPSAGAVQFDGLRFEHLHESDTDVNTRIKWLKLDTSNPTQPYSQLSHFYTNSGRSDSSLRVQYEYEKLIRANQQGTMRRGWNWLLRVMIGYGYQLWRAAILMLVIAVAGFGFGLAGYRAKLIAPTDKEANAYFIATDRTPTNYPRFSASMFSLEHSLPGVDFGQTATWSADTTAHWPNHEPFEIFVRHWFWLQKMAGWLLSIFFIAGLSGVVKTPK